MKLVPGAFWSEHVVVARIDYHGSILLIVAAQYRHHALWVELFCRSGPLLPLELVLVRHDLECHPSGLALRRLMVDCERDSGGL